jgi:hypothetical protein
MSYEFDVALSFAGEDRAYEKNKGSGLKIQHFPFST